MPGLHCAFRRRPLWCSNGFVVVQLAGAGDWVPLVGPDLWLHLGLGVGMIGLGVALTRKRVTPITA